MDPMLLLPGRLAHSVTLRCPHCRRAPLFRRLYVIHERCPVCGLAFQRDEGDFWGAMVFSYTIAGIAGLGVTAALIGAGVQDWLPIAFAASAAVIVAVLGSFPYAKSLWVYLLYFTRGQYAEYRPPGAPDEP